ncbi:MAG: thioredoxin domain-containing protein [Chthoniobacterales bacterium]
MKRFLPFLIILVIAVLALGAGTALFRAKREVPFAPIPGELQSANPGAVPPHFRGPPAAPIVLEEFADLQCPPCSFLAAALKKLEHDYEGRIRVVFRQFPLPMHEHAVEAARAAEAAGAQGKFWEMTDLLYENQVLWTKETSVTAIFEEYAQKIGLDLARFKIDCEDNKLLGRIGLDNQRGISLGVTSTPTLFINNQRVPQQSMHDAGLRAAIDNVANGNDPFPES